MPGPDPRTKRFMIKGMKNIVDRESRKKAEAAKEAAMEKVKIQDEKDMSNVQGAKDGGRMGYRMGGKCKLATKGKGRAYGKNS